MAQSAPAIEVKKDGSPSISVGPPNDGIKEMFDSLSRRAFEIFQSNGHRWGGDLSDWIQAEHEMFHAAHIDVSESDQGFTVRAEVPGFAAKDLEVNVDGRRLTISGSREKQEERKDKKTIYSETCSNRLLRVVDLPSDVNSQAASASLKDGILQLEIPKAAPARRIAVTSKP